MKAVLLALLGGAVTAGAVVYFAAKKTQADLTGQGEEMQAALEAAGRLTARQLQDRADAWAREIAAVGQAQITATTIATAMDVVQRQYGITPGFVSDVQQVTAVIERVRSNPWVALAGRVL